MSGSMRAIVARLAVALVAMVPAIAVGAPDEHKNSFMLTAPMVSPSDAGPILAGRKVRASDAVLRLPQAAIVSPVSPSEAHRILREVDPNAKVSNDVATARLEKTVASTSAAGGQKLPSATTLPCRPPATDPEIADLARGLLYDPVLINEYIRDNVEYTPTFGSKKGALGTFLDRQGNDFDQANLFLVLAQQSCLTASLEIGIAQYTLPQIANLLGVGPDLSVVGQTLANGGIPVATGTDASGGAIVQTTHAYASIVVNGATYYFDPSWKQHAILPPIDLAAATGYSQANFLSGALSGANVTGSSVQGVNRGQITSQLNTYASNMVSYIRTNNPGARPADIYGGKLISAGAPATGLVYATPTASTSMPATYETTFEVQMPGIDLTFYASQIYGRRLTVFYNPSNQPVIALEGVPQGSPGTAGALGQVQPITVVITHPYPTTFANQTVSPINVKVGHQYALMLAVGEMSRGVIDRHQRLLGIARQAGSSDSSETVLGAGLAILGSNWIAQASRAAALADTIGGMTTAYHHWAGVAGEDTAPYVDFPGQQASLTSTTADPNFQNLLAAFFASSYINSTLESTAVTQLQADPAVSTVKIFDFANNNGGAFFDVNASNWPSVQAQLINYAPGDVAAISNYISQGYRIVLPQHGDTQQNQWKGTGYYKIFVNATSTSVAASMGYLISGGYSGGFASNPAPFSISDVINFMLPEVINTSPVFSYEPIDLTTGNYTYDHEDLKIGSSDFPIGLGFTRSYNSGQRTSQTDLGYGWTHNFHITAQTDSDTFEALGDKSAVATAAAAVALFVSKDLSQNLQHPLSSIVIGSLIQAWNMDRLVNNAVTITQGTVTQKYIKLPDGTYAPPPNDASTITQNADQTYIWKDKNGIIFNFNTDGNLVSRVDPTGVTVSLAYNGKQIQSVSNNVGRELDFSYTGNQITTVSDKQGGRSVGFKYDPSKNLSTFVDALSQPTAYAYDRPGRMAQMFMPANPSNPFMTNAYDSEDHVKTQADGLGNLWQYFFADATRSTELNPQGDAHVYYYNTLSRPTQDTDALGNSTLYGYDGQSREIIKQQPEGNFTYKTYDSRNNVISIANVSKSASGQGFRTDSYTYDPTWNKVQTHIDADFRLTQNTYDSASNLIEVDQPIVNGVVPKTFYTYDSFGKVKTKTDPLRKVTSYAYDTSENETSVIDDYGTGLHLNLKTQKTYDAAGNVLSQIDANGNATVSQYDNLRRVTQTTGPAPFLYVTKLFYDQDGDLLETDKQSNLSGGFQKATQTYSLTDKVLTATDDISTAKPAGHTTSTTYDSVDRKHIVTDPQGRTTTYAYDGLSRVLTITDSSGTVARTDYYTPNGLDAGFADARANHTNKIYDGFDQLTKMQYANQSYESFGYDNVGNLTGKRTRAGLIISYQYDTLDRRILKSPANEALVTYTYDLAGHELSEGTSSTSTYTFHYDSAGREDYETQPGSLTVRYKRDASGNITSRTWPDGYALVYGFDGMNRLNTVKNGATMLAQINYDPLSRWSTISYGNKTSIGAVRELNDDLDATAHHFADGTQLSFSYTYNNVHQRLTEIVSGAAATALQHPTAAANVAYGVAKPINEYSTVGAATISYDVAGNLIKDGSNIYTYDTENHLVSAATTVPASHTVAYAYDAKDRRFSKTVDGLVTRYLEDDTKEIAEYDGSGHLLRRYLYAPVMDAPFATVDASGVVTYAHADGLGSVVALTSGTTGLPTDHYGYDPFGKPNSIAGYAFRFTGQRLDPESGLYYYRARYYHPVLGRFMQPDPIGDSGGINLYAYVSNDPINKVDPSGRIGQALFLFNSGWAPDQVKNLFLAQEFLFEEPPAIVRPPVENFPTDPSQPPGPGFEWRGRPGSNPGGSNGNWYNPNTGESLRPDLNHPEGIDPHYDYRAPDGNWYRWFPDGTIAPKA